MTSSSNLHSVKIEHCVYLQKKSLKKTNNLGEVSVITKYIVTFSIPVIRTEFATALAVVGKDFASSWKKCYLNFFTMAGSFVSTGEYIWV